MFESSVNSYGSQIGNLHIYGGKWFESSVNSYGSQINNREVAG